MGRADRDARLVRGRPARQPELSQVDRRMVDRAEVPLAVDPVRDAGGRRASLRRPDRGIVAIASALAIVGGVAMLLFQGVGGRIPDSEAPSYQHPLREVVWPIWRGDPLPPWKEGFREGSRFERTIGDRLFAKRASAWRVEWRWLQFVPFITAQVVAIGLLFRFAGSSRSSARPGL